MLQEQYLNVEDIEKNKKNEKHSAFLKRSSLAAIMRPEYERRDCVRTHKSEKNAWKAQFYGPLQNLIEAENRTKMNKISYFSVFMIEIANFN